MGWFGCTDRYQAERKDMTDFKQETLFETKMISQENRTKYQVIGQVFDTYWLVQFEDKLYIKNDVRITLRKKDLEKLKIKYYLVKKNKYNRNDKRKC